MLSIFFDLPKDAQYFIYAMGVLLIISIVLIYYYFRKYGNVQGSSEQIKLSKKLFGVVLVIYFFRAITSDNSSLIVYFSIVALVLSPLGYWLGNKRNNLFRGKSGITLFVCFLLVFIVTLLLNI